MASATRLNAISSIINNTGLNINPELNSQISIYQNQTPLKSLANAYFNSGSISANASSNVLSLLDTVGTGVSKGWFLLDMYPPNIAPVASANLKSWSPNSITATGDLIRNNNRVFKTTGNTFGSSFNSNVLTNCTLKGFSEVIKLQAGLPFKYNMNGFANVFSTVYGFVNLGFDNASSTAILKNTSYSDAGIGYTGPVDLVTNGIGAGAKILANVVSKFGTMYDINNISKLADPYIFGQNLLDQGLGYINDMEGQFTNIGLNTNDLTVAPQSGISTTQDFGQKTYNTSVGTMVAPAIVETTQATVAQGTSTEVVLKVYETVTGANLSAVISATNISVDTSRISTLRDFFDLSRVVSPDSYTQLKTLGINDLTGLSTHLSNKTSPAIFTNWEEMAKFFNRIEVPTLNYMPTGSTANILLSSTTTTITSTYGTGSGSFENPTLNDFFGATAGNPYASKFELLNLYYANTASTLGTLVTNLDEAVIDYCTQYAAYEASFVDDGMGGGSYSLPVPSITIVSSNVTPINSFLSNLPPTREQEAADRAVYEMLDKIALEVYNLQLAGINFDPATQEAKNSFAESFHMLASDKDQFETNQFFANIITDDIPGDTLRATIAEYINETVLATAGIVSYNDPDPGSKILEAKAQNKSLTEYLSRNK